MVCVCACSYMFACLHLIANAIFTNPTMDLITFDDAHLDKTSKTLDMIDIGVALVDADSDLDKVGSIENLIIEQGKSLVDFVVAYKKLKQKPLPTIPKRLLPEVDRDEISFNLTLRTNNFIKTGVTKISSDSDATCQNRNLSDEDGDKKDEKNDHKKDDKKYFFEKKIDRVDKTDATIKRSKKHNVFRCFATNRSHDTTQDKSAPQQLAETVRPNIKWIRQSLISYVIVQKTSIEFDPTCLGDFEYYCFKNQCCIVDPFFYDIITTSSLVEQTKINALLISNFGIYLSRSVNKIVISFCDKNTCNSFVTTGSIIKDNINMISDDILSVTNNGVRTITIQFTEKMYTPSTMHSSRPSFLLKAKYVHAGSIYYVVPKIFNSESRDLLKHYFEQRNIFLKELDCCDDLLVCVDSEAF